MRSQRYRRVDTRKPKRLPQYEAPMRSAKQICNRKGDCITRSNLGAKCDGYADCKAIMRPVKLIVPNENEPSPKSRGFLFLFIQKSTSTMIYFTRERKRGVLRLPPLGFVAKSTQSLSQLTPHQLKSKARTPLLC